MYPENMPEQFQDEFAQNPAQQSVVTNHLDPFGSCPVESTTQRILQVDLLCINMLE